MPSIGGSFDEGTDSVVVRISAKYQLTRWLSASLTYEFSRSKFETGESAPDNQVILEVTLTYTFLF